MPDVFREDDLLAYIRDTARALGPHVKTGPGDDMAVLDLQGRTMLVGVDQVVEGVHFLKGTDPELVGRKAVTRNVSDVAAMAARPVACVAACTLPADVAPGYARRLVDGVRRTAMQYNAPLVGGDTGIHRGHGPLMLSVTILAEPISPMHPPCCARAARPTIACMSRVRLADPCVQMAAGIIWTSSHVLTRRRRSSLHWAPACTR
jgi:thiamine monophosphate kinase